MRECQVLYARAGWGEEWAVRQVGVLVGDHALRMVFRHRPAVDAIAVDCCDPGHRWDRVPHPEAAW